MKFKLKQIVGLRTRKKDYLCVELILERAMEGFSSYDRTGNDDFLKSLQGMVMQRGFTPLGEAYDVWWNDGRKSVVHAINLKPIKNNGRTCTYRKR